MARYLSVPEAEQFAPAAAVLRRQLPPPWLWLQREQQRWCRAPSSQSGLADHLHSRAGHCSPGTQVATLQKVTGSGKSTKRLLQLLPQLWQLRQARRLECHVYTVGRPPSSASR
mmetsp:Transcript_10292/g.23212  ORF Transcript_10292/g.23212 Transcript_10292/m.23212 type:complete len:114 (+) Transcript_10292:1971-2312(+)